MNKNTIIAKKMLNTGCTVAFVSDEDSFTDERRGILPLFCLVEQKKDMAKYSAADKVVGAAAAFLYVKMNISEVYGETMSVRAKEIFERNKIPCFYDTLAEKIINRTGTDICPMERCVSEIDDTDTAVDALGKAIGN